MNIHDAGLPYLKTDDNKSNISVLSAYPEQENEKPNRAVIYQIGPVRVGKHPNFSEILVFDFCGQTIFSATTSYSNSIIERRKRVIC